LEGTIQRLMEKSLLIVDISNFKEILRKIVNLLGFYSETLEKELLEKYVLKLAMKLIDISLILEDEAIFLDILDLFHILTEFSGEFRRILCENQAFLLRINQIFKTKSENPKIFIAKGYIMGLFLNLSLENPNLFVGFYEEISVFLDFLLNKPFLKEIIKFLTPLISLKGSKSSGNEENEEIIEEKNEKTEDLEKNRDFFIEIAKSLELSLLFLHNLFENDLFEDLSSEEIEEELDFQGPKEENIENVDIFKENMQKIILNYNKRGYFLSLLSENLLISKSEMSLFANIETLGLESLINAVSEVNYLSISVLSAIFSQRDLCENHEKRDFLLFLWTKIQDFSIILKEMMFFPEFRDFFLLILRSFLDFLEQNRDFQTIIPTNDLFLLGKSILSLENEELSSIFFEILALRFPISLTNKEILSEIDLSQILDLLIQGFQSKDHFLIIAEALNALFDIFADETYNIQLKNKAILTIIEKISFEKAGIIKKNRKFIKETQQNLKEFIKYKRNLGV